MLGKIRCIQRWWRGRLRRAVWKFWFEHRATLAVIANKRTKASQSVFQNIQRVVDGELAKDVQAVIKVGACQSGGDV